MSVLLSSDFGAWSKPVETVITLFSKKFPSDLQEWWYSKKPGSKEPGNIFPN